MKKGDKYPRELPDSFSGGKWHYKCQGYVTVMGVIGNYAMVRFKGCLPFVESVKDLEKWKLKYGDEQTTTSGE